MPNDTYILSIRWLFSLLFLSRKITSRRIDCCSTWRKISYRATERERERKNQKVFAEIEVIANGITLIKSPNEPFDNQLVEHKL